MPRFTWKQLEKKYFKDIEKALHNSWKHLNKVGERPFDEDITIDLIEESSRDEAAGPSEPADDRGHRYKTDRRRSRTPNRKLLADKASLLF